MHRFAVWLRLLADGAKQTGPQRGVTCFFYQAYLELESFDLALEGFFVLALLDEGYQVFDCTEVCFRTDPLMLGDWLFYRGQLTA